jgi:hypothetical protein
MLNRPPPHTEEEIQALVDEFAPSYQPGVTILTAWFRLQAPRINGLLDANWKWSEIAAVLTRAGVIYGTGKPWTVEVLTAAYHRAKRPIKTPKPRWPAAGDVPALPDGPSEAS